jgi:hypothetical protein
MDRTAKPELTWSVDPRRYTIMPITTQAPSKALET